jgi:hypothetical protein
MSGRMLQINFKYGDFGTSPQKRSIQKVGCKLTPKRLRKLNFTEYKRQLCGGHGVDRKFLKDRMMINQASFSDYHSTFPEY